ncbi:MULTISPECIES: helix-turn-helix domain-containing protein [unclassified Dysgonomonas]|uniref:AraC family transcriptional regulator n=1 Tax=unclassified Dysgonomonas TaxID=2630389 RepID=UPI0013ED42C0|nr:MULTISPECIES: helix-turn-helix domain-containing protein [unclassified Dysgonomonas]
MNVFEIIYPSPILAPYIRYYWILDAESTSPISERVTPTGCIDLVFHKRDSMFSLADNKLQPQSFLCGLSTEFSDLTSITGKVSMIVTVFQPFGAKVFFDIPMSEFQNKTISIDDIGDKELQELEDQLLNETDNRTCIKLIESYLIDRLHSFKDYNYKRIVASIQAIDNKSHVSISSLAEIACLSYKQFNRIFTEHIGTNPKEFSRIIRFQRALHILQTKPQINLTQLAFEAGYYDQPHLIKEFKTFSGYTPSEYIAICDPYSDYFSNTL